MQHIAAVSQEEAKQILEDINKDDKDKGFYENYKYQITQNENGYLIVFLDCTNQLNNLEMLINQSLIIIGIGLIIVFLFVSFLSKKALNPIIENMEKQKQFITNAGHELKTPVAVILANVDVMELTSSKENIEWLKSIKNQALRLDSLIKSLLELSNIEAAGLYKKERIITTPQRADIKVNAGDDVLNFCANNYLGLSDNKRLIEAAKAAMDTHGYGMSSVRFICGTQDLHKQLEAAISDYFKTEDTILYAACFDANGGLFEPLLTEEDAIISDALNHASIIDGVRLCKAKRYRYANADMADLERCLQEAQAQRFRIIATDGVFSMDGNVAPMDKICDLAEKYDALVMVDESYRSWRG